VPIAQPEHQRYEQNSEVDDQNYADEHQHGLAE
jgi:hypothetical protein